jgi:hypothetical protein
MPPPGGTVKTWAAAAADFVAIAPRYPVFRIVLACDPDDPLAATRPGRQHRSHRSRRVRDDQQYQDGRN